MSNRLRVALAVLVTASVVGGGAAIANAASGKSSGNSTQSQQSQQSQQNRNNNHSGNCPNG